MADPLTEFILINHKIFIVCCLILFIYFAGTIIIFVLKSSGLIFNRQFHDLNNKVLQTIHNIKKSNYKTIIETDNLNKKDFLYFIIAICAIIFPKIAFIAGQIVRIQLCVLFWIFVNWMLIKMLVPIIIIFPIPIFPYIFILPLQIMMLEFIPPFKVLTNLGTLPLLYRLLTRIIDPGVFNDFINNYIKPNITDVGDYFFYHVRNLGKEYADQLYGDKPIDNNSKEGEERVKKDNEAISNISGEDEEKGMKKYQEYKENDSVKTTMDKIDQDTQICIGLNQQFKPYGSSYTSEIATDMGNSFNPYSKCYTSAIKSYIKTSIAPPP